MIATGKYLKGGTQELRYRETMAVASLDHDAEYPSRLANQRKVKAALIDLMDRNRVDALVYPVKALTAPAIGSSDDGVRDNSISSATGLPAIVLPAGMHADGLPIALELLGRPFSEARLIQLAQAYERRNRPRPVPPHLHGGPDEGPTKPTGCRTRRYCTDGSLTEADGVRVRSTP